MDFEIERKNINNLSKFSEYLSKVSFFELNQSIDSFSFSQLEDALDYIRPKILKGWDYITKEKLTDLPLKQDDISKGKKQDFLKLLSKRTMLDEKVALQLFLHYLSLIVANGVDLPDLDEFLLSEITSFYFRERIEIIKTIAFIFRKAEFLDIEPLNNKQEIYIKTAKWLIANGIEKNCILMLKETLNFELTLENFRINYGREYEDNRSLQLIHNDDSELLKRQMLKETVSVLELLYVIYYTGHICSLNTFDELYKEYFLQSKYGNFYFQFITSLDSRHIIRRISSLCILVTKQILQIKEDSDNINNSNNLNNTSSIIPENQILNYINLLGEIFQEFKDDTLSTLKLIWGCYIRFNTSTQYRSIELHRKSMEQLVSESIFCKKNAFSFLISLFDHRHPQYSYLGRSENIFAYQSDVESVIWCILKILPIENFEFLVSDILNCLRLVLKKNIELKSRFFSDFISSERNLQHQEIQHSESGDRILINDPYLKLFKFIQTLFPWRTYFIEFLTLLIFDDKSSYYVAEKISEIGYYCFEIDLRDKLGSIQNQLLLQKMIDNSSGYTTFYLRELFKDEAVLLPYFNNNLSKEMKLVAFNQYCDKNKIVVTMGFQNSGWTILASSLRDYIQRYTFNSKFEEKDIFLIKETLNLLYRILVFGDKKSIYSIENAILGIFGEKNIILGRDNFFGKSLFSILVSLSETLKTKKSILEGEILSLILKCFRFFANENPVFVTKIFKDLCLNFYNGVIYSECKNGFYPCTIQILKLAGILTQNHPAPRNNLLDVISFITSNIFSVFESWKYQKISQKWNIAKSCIKIFNSICSDSFWRSQTKDCATDFIFSLYSNGSIFQNLFNIIGAGHIIFKKQLEEEIFDDALLVQQLIVEALQLFKSLLKILITQYTLYPSTSSITPFEQTLLTGFVGPKDFPFIATLFDYIDNIHPTEVIILAFKCINLVAKLTQYYHPRPPSLIGYLNRTSSEANTVINKCMMKLNQNSTHPKVKESIFALISTAVEYQRGLADKLLLGIKENDERIEGENKDEINNVLINGCIRNVIENMRELLIDDIKDNSKYLKSLLYCTKIIQSIFVGGHYEQIVKALSNDIEILWNLLIGICNSLEGNLLTQVNGESIKIKILLEDNNLINSVTTIFSLISVELYNLNRKEFLEKDVEYLEPFLSESFQNNLVLIFDLVNRYLLSIINDHKIFENLNNACKKYIDNGHNFNLNDYIITKRIHGEILFDTNRMKRWENHECNELISICKELNSRFKTSESCISLLKSIRAVISALNTPSINSLMSKTISELLEFIIPSLRLGTSKSSFTKEQHILIPFNNVCIFYPVVPQMNQLTHHYQLILSEILLSTVSGSIKLLKGESNSIELKGNLLKEFWPLLSYTLDSQFHAANWIVVKNILAFILNILTTPQILKVNLLDIWNTISPVILKISTFNDHSIDCCEIALNILQIFPPIYFNHQNIQHFCQQLSIGLSLFSNTLTHSFIYSLLLILQGIAGTEFGCEILLNNFVIDKLANATYVHLGKVYENGKRSMWHMIWCQEIQLLTHMFNSVNRQYESSNTYQHSALSNEILEKICNFCISHQDHISKILRQTLSQENICLVSLIELESISMLIFALARSGKLYWNKQLIDNTIACVSQCQFHIDRLTSFLAIVHPISDDEINLYSQENARKQIEVSQRKNDRQHLTWSSLIILCLVGTLRNLLSSLRCLSYTPNESLEKKENPHVIYNEYTLRVNLVPLIRSFTDILLRVYQNIQQKSESDKPKSFNERSARKITNIAISAIEEDLLIVAIHIFTNDNLDHQKKSPVEKELTLTIESVKKEIISLQQMNIVKSSMFDEVVSLLDSIYSKLNE